MKAVNKLLNQANIYIKHRDCAISADGKTIKDVYKGYVSSFGAMVIQNGLSAALAINMKSEDEGKDRIKIIEAIARMLTPKYSTVTNAEALLNYSCANEGNRLLKEDVINCSIALKLMMRTYQFIKPNNQQENA
jgi:CRISPR-associated protein Cmr5